MRYRNRSALFWLSSFAMAFLLSASQIGLAQGSNARGLDVQPESGQNDNADTHTLTATIYDQFGDPFTAGGITVDFEFFEGSVSDPEGKTSPASPDRSCTTASGVATCAVQYTNPTPNAGRDLICAWISGPDGPPEHFIGTAQGQTGTEQEGRCGELPGQEERLTDLSGEDTEPSPEDDRIDVISKDWGASQCNDDIDNDGDGRVDFGGTEAADPGCGNLKDNDESPPQPFQCDDGLDNDGDGDTDLADDGCNGPTDNSETHFEPAQCNDGIDNDGDGEIDLDDSGCENEEDDNERCGDCGPPDYQASHVTIRYNQTRSNFAGQVTSAYHECETGRLVEVFKYRRGPNVSVGTDTTGGKGRYTIPNDRGRGRYFARVYKRLLSDGVFFTVCQRDRSRSLTVNNA